MNIWESNACILVSISVHFQAFQKEIPTGKMMGLMMGMLCSPVVMTLVVMTLAQIWDFTFILFNMKIQIFFVLSGDIWCSPPFSEQILCAEQKEVSESYLHLKGYIGLFYLVLTLNHFFPFLQGWRTSVVSDRDPHDCSLSDKKGYHKNKYGVFSIFCGVYVSFHQCMAKFVACFEILMENGRS